MFWIGNFHYFKLLQLCRWFLLGCQEACLPICAGCSLIQSQLFLSFSRKCPVKRNQRQPPSKKKKRIPTPNPWCGLFAACCLQAEGTPEIAWDNGKIGPTCGWPKFQGNTQHCATHRCQDAQKKCWEFWNGLFSKPNHSPQPTMVIYW